MKCSKMWLIGVAVLGLAASHGFAQTANPPAAAAPAQPAPAEGKNPNAPPMPSLGILMQRAGGSLARAELALRNESSAPTIVSTSYYSVPEPQPKLIHKHDLVTIIIREDSNFSSTGTTDLKHTNDFDMQLNAYMQLHMDPRLLLAQQTPSTPFELQGSGARDFKGDATVDRTDTLTANITASVVDVKPNGNLLLQATKSIKTDEEEQMFILSGVCRVEDVTADNTVLSTQLFGLQLEKRHKGAVRDTGNRGIITKILDKLNPF